MSYITNYPAGVSSSDFDPIFCGETYQCDVCDAECSHEDEPLTELNGNNVCPDCREMCAGFCGEYISDESILNYGKIVNFRDLSDKGRRVCAHAECAADYLLRIVSGGSLDGDSSREEIDAAVVPELAAAQVIGKYPHFSLSSWDGRLEIVKQSPPLWDGDVIAFGNTEAEALANAAKAAGA